MTELWWWADRDHAPASGPPTRVADGSLVHLGSQRRYTLAAGETDVRGRTVRDDGGEKLGRVVDLVIDTALGRVTYLEVRFVRAAARRLGTSARLVPVGQASLDPRGDVIVRAPFAPRRPMRLEPPRVRTLGTPSSSTGSVSVPGLLGDGGWTARGDARVARRRRTRGG